MQINEIRKMASIRRFMNVRLRNGILSGLTGVAFACASLTCVQAELPAVKLKLFAEGFTSPTALTPLNDGKGTLLLADQVGLVHLVTASGIVRGQPFLSLSHRMAKLNLGFEERGLLGIAAHPKFKENGKIYVYYSAPLRASAPSDWNHTSRISEFTVMDNDSERIDINSEKVLLSIDQPYFNHNAGSIAFGPEDGYLYIAVGDGGNANGRGIGHSEIGNSQDLSNMLGKILRIDVDQGDLYGIPADNPFQGANVKSEIYAIGLRNPWRISFDRGGEHALFAADIGQNLYEEVNIITKGANYGWNVREGFHCFNPEKPTETPENCPDKDIRGHAFTDPILEYKNVKAFRNAPDAYGISITGGYVYRGKSIEGLVGKYIFADWSRNWAMPDGVILVGSNSANGQWSLEALELGEQGKVGSYIVAFGEDAKGELYVLTNATNGLMNRKGKIYKIVAK
jgi:glucose/arabinose dehydrogenase